MPQSIWKGAISFGLVSIPVRLFSATEEKDVSFRQVHREDGGRIRYKRVCSVDGEEVAYGDIAKGYELPDGEMVVLDDDDFANLPISSSRAVEVLSFVPADQIDAVQMGKPYYCDPTGGTPSRTSCCATRWRRPTGSPSSRSRCVSASGWPCCAPATASWCCRRCCGRTRCASRELEFLDDDVTVRPQELAMAESYINALSGDFEPDGVLRRLPRGARGGHRGQGRRPRGDRPRRGARAPPGRSST